MGNKVVKTQKQFLRQFKIIVLINEYKYILRTYDWFIVYDIFRDFAFSEQEKLNGIIKKAIRSRIKEITKMKCTLRKRGEK
jgi:hypothetical protein